MNRLLNFFAVSEPSGARLSPEQTAARYRRLRWQVFLSATLGYGLFYVCRLSLNVIKKPLVDAGVVSETELGIIGSGLFITYAIGKFTNGFLADRSNIRRFLAAGLLVSALINLALGFVTSFGVFLALWAVNGWAQSMGAAPCVVALSRWFSDRDRGSFYGFWSSSHNIGEAITFIVTAVIVSAAGWQWGFRGAAVMGLVGFVIVAVFMRDTPESCGLPPVGVYSGETTATEEACEDSKSVAEYQKQVLRNPAIWMLALGSSFMYISRYAVNSWGIFFLEAGKGYSNIEASSVVSISSICGIIGTVSCGWVSDRFFNGKRNMPALVFGIMNVISLSLFLFGPAGKPWLDITAMVLFGLAIGALICYLGGLMAVDIASKKASGAALGVVGIASYIGAAVQDLVSGIAIGGGKTAGAVYDFTGVSIFWISAAVLSVLCVLTVWNAKAKD
ncbi:MAG: MFS transporter [Muribaculaceae bacterium]|nr:MFS transporter [Muribaculaceae bacterium]